MPAREVANITTTDIANTHTHTIRIEGEQILFSLVVVYAKIYLKFIGVYLLSIFCMVQ